MTISEAIATHLLSVTELDAYIDGRLFPEQALEKTESPYIVYHLEIREPEQPIDQGVLFLEAILDLFVLSRSYDQAFAIADLLRTELNYFKATMGGGSGVQVESCLFDSIIGGYSPEVDLFTAHTSFTIQYVPEQ